MHLLDAELRVCEAFGTNSEQALKAKLSLGRGFFKCGDNQRASRLLAQGVDQCKVKFGGQHPISLEAMNDLYQVLTALGRKEEAYSLIEEVKERSNEMLGHKHPLSLEARLRYV